MADGEVLDAFAAEAQSLAAALAGESPAAFGRPSPCPPWTVAELFWHVTTAAGRVSGMLAEPEPGTGDPGARGQGLVSAAGYYQPDQRFSAATNADRIGSAQRGAAGLGPAELRAEFDRAWPLAWAAARDAPPGRRVRTRHGDLMLLTEFMRSRVLELAVHGLDLAAGTGRDPWLTDLAAGVVQDLILPGPGGAEALLRTQLGWDRVTLIAKATGRRPLTAVERAAVQAAGVRWLALA